VNYLSNQIKKSNHLRNGTRYRHIYNGILIGTYTRTTQGCHFEWPWASYWNIEWHEAARGLSATAELLVFCLMRTPNSHAFVASVGLHLRYKRLGILIISVFF